MFKLTKNTKIHKIIIEYQVYTIIQKLTRTQNGPKLAKDIKLIITGLGFRKGKTFKNPTTVKDPKFKKVL